MQTPVYLDHAATSSPKPEVVVECLTAYFQSGSLSAGRSSFARTEELDRKVSAARNKLAKLIGAETGRQIVFTSGGTESLNLALNGWLQAGDHVLVTMLEHNSVLRPLHALQQSLGIEMETIAPNAQGQVEVSSINAACRESTRLICCVHASNVTGIIQPVEEICRFARSRQIATLVDAAQTVGHMEIDVQQMQCDFLAAPAHKGLLAPLGTGFLHLNPQWDQIVQPLMRGGTGTVSESTAQPKDLPHRFESGSPNVPGLIGLNAALEIVTPKYIVLERQRIAELRREFVAAVGQINGVQVYCADNEHAVGVVSLNLEGQDPRILSMILDQNFGIETRAGFHCAPLAHEWLGTTEVGGSVRFSFGHNTTREQIQYAADSLKQIAEMLSVA